MTDAARVRYDNRSREQGLARGALRPIACAIERSLKPSHRQIGSRRIAVTAAVVYGQHRAAIAREARCLGDVLPDADITRALVDIAERPVRRIAAQPAEMLSKH